MRVAAIDVGTNSTRLLVAQEHPEGFRSLERRTVITRLGQDVDRRRALAPEALERTLGVIADYAATCGEFGVERITVTGTSAVRDARNREDFFDGVARLTGQQPRMLSGEEEARATFAGVLSDLDVPEDGALVVDIGGGSTELIYGRAEPEELISMDVGCVRMLEKHLHSDPPTDAEIDAMRREVSATIEAFIARAMIPHGASLVGVAGTVTQLAALKAGLATYDTDVIHHMTLSHGDVRLLARRLRMLPFDKRRRIKGLEPGRVDVIVPGAEILLCVMEAFDAPEVLVSEKDILDGLVMSLLGAR